MRALPPRDSTTCAFRSISAANSTYTAVADATGTASFDFATIPGTLYSYSISVGGETVSSGTFLAGSWESAGSWFETAPDGTGGIIETGGTWTVPPVLREGGNAFDVLREGGNAFDVLREGGNAFVSGESAVFSLSAAARAAGDGRLVRADAAVSYPSVSAMSELARSDLADSIAVVSPVEDAEGGAPRWAAYVGGAWTLLSGGPEPQSGTPYTVRLEGDFASASPRVRLSVSADGGDTFLPLSDASTGAEWFAPSDATKRGLAEIAAQGDLSIASLRGTLADGAVAEAGGVRYASLADALRAAGPGGTVTLLTNATAPASLASGRTILPSGHLLVTFDDFRGTLFFLQ